MKEFAKFDGDEQLVWDQSSYDSLLTCAYKYKLGRIEGWRRPAASVNLPMTWGIVAHECFEAYDLAIFEEKSVEEAVNAGMQKAVEMRESLVVEEGGKKDNARTLHTLLRAIVWYGIEYANDQLVTARMPDGTPAIEKHFRAQIPTIDKKASGIVDKLVHFDGGLFILDRKTTATTLDRNFFSRFLCDTQKYWYIWALKEGFGLPIDGFIVDAVQTLVGSTRFARQAFYVSDSQIEEWLLDMKYHIGEAEKYAASGNWPQRFSGCNRYGKCEFLKICGSEPEFRRSLLETDFVKRER